MSERTPEELAADCVFCEIVAGRAPAQQVETWDDAVAFMPLNPVVSGHVLVVPRQHVADATEAPDVTAMVMRRAAELATAPCNIITSAGSDATQTVFHLHVHIVPRRTDDGLLLPWSSQEVAPYVPSIASLDEWGSDAAAFALWLTPERHARFFVPIKQADR